MYVVVEFRNMVLRLVPPYMHVFQTHVKKRWYGWTLREVYDKEFLAARDYDTQNAIEVGCIRVNGQTCSSDQVVLHDDVITHPTHRHEPPTLYVPAREMILFDDGDLVVVEKPPSIPIHAGGQYSRNTLVSIFKNELGVDLKPVHRLDRLVSGLVLFARTSQTATKMTNLLAHAPDNGGCKVQKTYVARVHGKFPATNAESQGEDPWLQVSAPLVEADAKRGKMKVCNATGKESISRFALLRYDPESNTSLVQCEPLTGRTHQLRLHLQHLGFPIPNDPIYGLHEFGEVDDDEEEDEAYTKLLQTTFQGHGTGEEGDDPELLALALKACHMCPKTPRFPKSIQGIFLHSIRVRRFEKGKLVFEYQGRMPSWACDKLILL